MARAKERRDIMDLMLDWQGVETDTVEYVDKAIPQARNRLTKTMLKVIKLEAEKHCLLQGMIIDSLKKESFNMSPDELGVLSGYINRYLEMEGKELCDAEAGTKSGSVITRYLLTYLMEDLKTQSSLLRQFDDDLKNASIATSVTSKKFDTARTA
jgi:hypothetical protein